MGDRLREERLRLGENQDSLASLLGVSREMLGKYERSKAVPGGDVLARALAARMDVVYILGGERLLKSPVDLVERSEDGTESTGAPRDKLTVLDPTIGSAHFLGAALAAMTTLRARQTTPLVLPVLYEHRHIKREFQVIPKYRDASAGRGLSAAEDMDFNDAGVMAFDRRWMQETFGRTDGLATVRVHGDSMEPTLVDGETIVIDTHVSKVDTSGVYVIRVAGNVLVKRVQHKLDGSLVIKSDNPAYEPEVVRPGAIKVHVAGRMVWPRTR
ncbi:UNVERIFIED_ORG: helix-turn-helix domain-containing protein [Shinella sp. XGS7]|nr:XRE family transcriptional regulator [Shinella sp. XGS7]